MPGSVNPISTPALTSFAAPGVQSSDGPTKASSEQWSYTEFARLKGAIKNDQSGAKQAAAQFESLFVGMWLKSAREATSMLSQDGVFSSEQLQMHQGMMDQQLAMDLSRNGGIGLAEIIERQLGGSNEIPQPTSIADELNHQAVKETPPADRYERTATEQNNSESVQSAIDLINQMRQ